MRPQGVPERQRRALLRASRPYEVEVMRVRPSRGTMEEGAEGVVRVRHVDVAEPREASGVLRERPEVGDRDLDVDDRFRGEAGNRGGAVVIDANRERAQGRR